MSRYCLAYPNYRPVLLAPSQPSPIGGTWRPAAYIDPTGQVHRGLACEQAGPKFRGCRYRGFRLPGGQLVDVLATRVAWVDEEGVVDPDLVVEFAAAKNLIGED